MTALSQAAQQAWPPFVLVTGLLLIGVVADADGLFERVGAAIARSSGGPLVTYLGCLLLVALVTATMNLDTAVVFLTPVLVLVARGRGLDELPFLYGALFMANASSLFLPGANLTNLLVLGDGLDEVRFAEAMFWPALTAMLVTAAGLTLMHLRRLGPDGGGPVDLGDIRGAGAREVGEVGEVAGVERIANARADGAARAGRLGVAAAIAAAALTVFAPEPALPVLAVGVVAAALACLRRLLTPGAVLRAVGPVVVLALFALSVALGVLARSWDGPAQLLEQAGPWETTGVATVASVLVNNLPAAVLLSAQEVAHPRALLIGLGVGPNLAFTGSLSCYLWWRAGRQVGANPSIARVSRIGVVLAPLAIIGAVAALGLAGG